MKTCLSFAALLASSMLAFPQNQQPGSAPEPPPQPGPAVYPAVPGQASPPEVYVYEQKAYGGRSYLVSPEQAQSIINRFKEAYARLGSPRFLIYVNRELIDEDSGMKLSSHKQIVESSRTTPEGNSAASNPTAADAARRTDRVVSTNIYRVRDRQPVALADRQTVRDLERLFGRPLRMAGVQLADQRVASQLIGGKTLDNFFAHTEGEQAARDREAILKVADVVLEILISSRSVTVPEIAGDRTYTVPDIQATAIRLSDARILGQATAADLIGQGGSAARSAQINGVREISEATALSLMEDMMLH